MHREMAERRRQSMARNEGEPGFNTVGTKSRAKVTTEDGGTHALPAFTSTAG